MWSSPHPRPMRDPAMTVRSLKEQAKGRERALKLRAKVARMKVKVMKLDKKVGKLRRKIGDYEERANRLDEGVAPPRV